MITTSWPKRVLWNLMVALFLPIFVCAALLPSRRRDLLVWGSAPLKGNRYWSEALRAQGLPSVTIMSTLYGINQRGDFDRYFEDFAPRGLPRSLRFALGSCLALLHVIRRASVLHTNYLGFALGISMFWRLESHLYRLAGVKVVIIPFGGDAYLMSRIVDTSLRYALLASYPQLARRERFVRERVEHWNEHADVVVGSGMIDGLGRWDTISNQVFVIDTSEWRPKETYSDNNGTDGPVRVMHTPNHRGYKGTEFLLDAVRKLQDEGLQVELVLLEKIPNDEVKELMRGVDILAEQFLANAYAMSGIEGMATGLPVMANLEHEAYTRVFRRFGFLDECPILSTTPETLVGNLRTLVVNPGLRRELGAASRAFAEKYHSFEMAQYLFGSIHDKLMRGADVDLINLFHPLKSEYNRRRPRIEHPLIDSHLPAGWKARHFVG